MKTSAARRALVRLSLALWRYPADELRAGLDLKILPLRADTPLFLERAARPDFAQGDALELKRVSLGRETSAVVEVVP